MVIDTRPMSLAGFHCLLVARPDARLELEPDGSVFEGEPSSARIAHNLLQARLAAWFDRQGRGLTLTEVNVEWGERPEYLGDVVFYAGSRIDEIRDASTGRWVFHSSVPPDLEIELRSSNPLRGLQKSGWDECGTPNVRVCPKLACRYRPPQLLFDPSRDPSHLNLVFLASCFAFRSDA